MFPSNHSRRSSGCFCALHRLSLVAPQLGHERLRNAQATLTARQSTAGGCRVIAPGPQHLLSVFRSAQWLQVYDVNSRQPTESVAFNGGYSAGPHGAYDYYDGAYDYYRDGNDYIYGYGTGPLPAADAAYARPVEAPAPVTDLVPVYVPSLYLPPSAVAPVAAGDFSGTVPLTFPVVLALRLHPIQDVLCCAVLCFIPTVGTPHHNIRGILMCLGRAGRSSDAVAEDGAEHG